ncbi:hypothetical protein GUJ93_ZPchr0006g41091 [Zizania palustris]|uniref:Uncharacterized protein n=1 Tax=Zizania palustris TaxID=103762 RepID=A0A8J5SI76_ZIZPA|nr:hypothetical protein GUJ93_ZPchr0006g41091 [Zizania palustris]
MAVTRAVVRTPDGRTVARDPASLSACPLSLRPWAGRNGGPVVGTRQRAESRRRGVSVGDSATAPRRRHGVAGGGSGRAKCAGRRVDLDEFTGRRRSVETWSGGDGGLGGVPSGPAAECGLRTGGHSWTLGLR